MPQLKIPHVTTKTQCSRINKIKILKKKKKKELQAHRSGGGGGGVVTSLVNVVNCTRN